MCLWSWTNDISNWLISNGYEIICDEYLVDHIVSICIQDETGSYPGTDILNWLLNSGINLSYTHALRYASDSGRTDILDWFYNSGLEMKYGPEAMDCASSFGHINVLNWWLKSGLELIYSNHSIDLGARKIILMF